MISFLEFLKKYSTIPNQFLEDFFKISDYTNIDSGDFIVNLQDVVKWLKIYKHVAKDTLLNSYKQNIDYKIIKHKKEGGKGSVKGGYNKENIMMLLKLLINP